MQTTVSKSKLTLWVSNDTKKFGKQWAKEHNESLSKLFSDFILRLKKELKSRDEVTPIVHRLSGIISHTRVDREDYKKHIESKHLNG